MDKYASLIDAFKQANVQLWEVLSFPPNQIAHRANRSATEISEFIPAYLKSLEEDLPISSPSAMETLHLPTGDHHFDALLGGGIPTCGLTEITGQSSVGKTGLAMQLCLAAQPVSSKCVYISTESAFATRRMAQIAKRFPNASMDNVLSRECRTADEIYDLFSTDLAKVVDLFGVKLIVIDSMAPFVEWNRKGQHGKPTLPTVGKTIREFAQQKKVAIVLTNQVRDRGSVKLNWDYEYDPLYTANQEQWISGWTEEPFHRGSAEGLRRKTPALGFTWSQQIDQRLVLKRIPDTQDRTMSLVFSAWTNPDTLTYSVDDTGLHTLPLHTVPDL